MFYDRMSNPETEQAIAAIYHGLRSASKKGRKIRDPQHEAERQAYHRHQAKERYSHIPPGWDGEPWKPWGED